ncbi:uncharacterized protein C8A04DRAFT_29962, partial [Dichotomopilus funicola]
MRFSALLIAAMAAIGVQATCVAYANNGKKCTFYNPVLIHECRRGHREILCCSSVHCE